MGLLSAILHPGGLLSGGYAPAPQPAQAGLLARPDPATDGNPGFWSVLDQVLGGSTITDARETIRQRELARRLEPALMELKQRQAQAQLGAYGAADTANLTPEEKIALGFSPADLGKALATGSDAYTLGRNDQRYFRNGQVSANTTAPDPQVVNGRLVGPDGRVIYEPPQYETVGDTSRLVQTSPGVQAGAVAQDAAPLAAADPLTVLARLAPNATVSSGYRTPQHNADVGGVPNSYHTRGHGQAVDLIPHAGETMAQLAARVKASGQFAEVINEGDHVHVAWDAHGAQSAPSGALKVVVDAQPKPSVRPATAQEKAAYGIPADVPAQMNPDGKIDVISGTGANLKRIPPQIAGGFVANNQAIAQIDQAIAQIRANPDALGIKNRVGDTIMQRVDPQGVPTRAAVANIGSKVLHDRSGAAVTIGEQPRLVPFIPQPFDTADAAIKKLESLKQQYINANTEIDTAYGEDTGYAPLGGMNRVPGGGSAAPATKAQPKASGQRRLSPQEAAKLPKGARFIGLDGVERIRQ